MKDLGIKELYVMPAGKGFISPNGGYVHLGDDLTDCIFGKEKAKLMVKTYGLPVYKLTMQPADDLEPSELPEDQPLDTHIPYRQMVLVRDGKQIKLDQWNGSRALIEKYNLTPKSRCIPILGQRWNLPGPCSKTIEIGDWLTKDILYPYVYTRADIKQLRKAGWEAITNGTE